MIPAAAIVSTIPRTELMAARASGGMAPGEGSGPEGSGPEGSGSVVRGASGGGRPGDGGGGGDGAGGDGDGGGGGVKTHQLWLVHQASAGHLEVPGGEGEGGGGGLLREPHRWLAPGLHDHGGAGDGGGGGTAEKCEFHHAGGGGEVHECHQVSFVRSFARIVVGTCSEPRASSDAGAAAVPAASRRSAATMGPRLCSSRCSAAFRRRAILGSQAKFEHTQL